MNYITDRTQADVDNLKRLLAIGWDNMTDSQKEEYRGRASLGAYNHTDLERVEDATQVLAGCLGLSLINRFWIYSDIPTESEMQRYLDNVKAVLNKFGETHDISGFPVLPDSMSHLTWEGANNIEKVLKLIEQVVLPNYPAGEPLGEFTLGMCRLGDA